MKTLTLLIKTSFFNKIDDFMHCTSILSNKSLMEEATKCLFKTKMIELPCGEKTMTIC